MNRKNKTPLKHFIGRTQELAHLEGLIQSQKPAMAVIKGRRRVGKSRLAAQFACDKVFLPFAGLAPVEGVTEQDQRNVFANHLSTLFHLPPFTFSDWLDGFALLSRHLGKQPTVILFDKISWMGSKDPTFLPKLKMWWDTLSEKQSKIVLILCGSVSTWIEENIIKSTAFFGRIALHLTLNPLSLAESCQLLKERGVKASPYDIFRILAIMGGIPWYLENVQPYHSIDENIKRLCFSPNGLLVEEFNLIFHDLFDRRGDVYKKIITILSEGMRTYAQIRDSLNYPAGGGVAPYLDALIISGYVTKHQSWSIKTGKPGSKSLFRLSDNYLRFYLKAITPQLGKIATNSFKDMPLSALPGWSALTGLQTENMLLANRSQILKAIGIYPQDVVMDNPFLQNTNQSHEGVQIDYLVQTTTNTLYLCEFRFTRNEIRSDVIQDIEKKIKKLALPRGFSICPVLLHFGEVADTVQDAGFFYRIININKFLNA